MTLIHRAGVVLALAVITARGIAQDAHQSHVPVPLPTDVDPAQLFRDRIQQARLPVDLADLIKQFGAGGMVRNEEQLRKIVQANPQIQDMLQNPEKADQFRDLLDKAIQTGKPPLGLNPEMIQQKLQDFQQRQPASIPPPRRLPPRFNERQPPIDKAEQARKRELANQVAQWVESFQRDRLPESLRNSPAMKGLFHGLSESAVDALSGGGGADGGDAQLARLESRWTAARDWLPKEMPAALRRIKMPDLSRVAPNIHLPQIEMTAPRMPAVGGFSGSGMDFRSVANVLLGVAGVAILAVVIWRLSGGRLTAPGGGQRPLGPWPLDPARVTSRADLIRAFESLTLLRCGEPARSWHHRAIAECLGGSEAERRTAAEQLAALYEQARYAPATGGEPDWSAARGPLTLLAGAG